MNQEGLPNTINLELDRKATVSVFDGDILVSLSGDFDSDDSSTTVTVGSVGHDNVTKELRIGDFLRYDAGKKGKFEVRLRCFFFDSDTGKARLRITKLE